MITATVVENHSGAPLLSGMSVRYYTCALLCSVYNIIPFNETTLRQTYALFLRLSFETRSRATPRVRVIATILYFTLS